MNQNKIFILILLLLLFMVSCSKILLIPTTFIIAGFFIAKKQYNIALIVISALFFMSLVYNNKLEPFNNYRQMNAELHDTTPPIPSPGVAIMENYQNQNSKGEFFNRKERRQQLRQQRQQRQQEGATTPHRVNLKEYNELMFVFTSLLENEYFKKNRDTIENFIDSYRIKSIFDLSRTVLNKEMNPQYNNFLEKITCIDDFNDIDYLSCDSPNYKKVYAFCELLYVFTFDLDKIVELINKNNIMSVSQLCANRVILQNFNNKSSYGYESLGLEYYLREKTFANKYYDILELLELDEILNNDKSEIGFTLEARLFNYHNSNKAAVKDLSSIMVLFDYYNIFDRYILNLEDDEYNWNLGILKSVNLNLPYWDSVVYFKKYNVKERIIKSINKITSVDDEFLNRGSNPKNPFSSDNNNRLSALGNMNINSNNVNQNSKPYVEEEDVFAGNFDPVKRYKTLYEENEIENEEIQDKLDKKLNLKFIKENFNQKMIDITKDIAILISQKCNLDCSDSSNPLFSKGVFYVGEIIKILTKEERMLYVGILMVIISIIFNFIVASK